MITLKSDKIEIIGILKRTKARFFKDLKVGDIIQFTMIFSPAKRNGKRLYASHLQVKNLETGDYFQESLTNMYNYLDNFDYQEIDS